MCNVASLKQAGLKLTAGPLACNRYWEWCILSSSMVKLKLVILKFYKVLIIWMVIWQDRSGHRMARNKLKRVVTPHQWVLKVNLLHGWVMYMKGEMRVCVWVMYCWHTVVYTTEVQRKCRGCTAAAAAADCDPLIDRLSLSVLYCCDDLILSRNDQPVCVSPGISVYMIIIGRKSL